MANALYDRGRQGFLAGEIDWDANDIRLILIDEADDTIDLTLDEDLADRAAAARVATSSAFGSKITTAGVADAADVTLTSVTGDVSESIDIYQHTGTESTSLLIANIDTATGLPVTPNGGNITIVAGRDRLERGIRGGRAGTGCGCGAACRRGERGGVWSVPGERTRGTSVRNARWDCNRRGVRHCGDAAAIGCEAHGGYRGRTAASGCTP